MFKVSHWLRSGVFIVNFKHISYLVLVFLIVNFEHVIADWEYYNKNHHLQKHRHLVREFWEDIFICIYRAEPDLQISQSVLYRGILQILQVVRSSSFSSMLSLFEDSTKLLHCLDGLAAVSPEVFIH